MPEPGRFGGSYLLHVRPKNERISVTGVRTHVFEAVVKRFTQEPTETPEAYWINTLKSYFENKPYWNLYK